MDAVRTKGGNTGSLAAQKKLEKFEGTLQSLLEQAEANDDKRGRERFCKYNIYVKEARFGSKFVESGVFLCKR